MATTSEGAHPSESPSKGQPRVRTRQGPPPNFPALVASGRSDPALAAELGVSAQTILRWRKAAGLASHWSPPMPTHGTEGRYKKGCRCDDCKAANTARHQRQVERRRAEAPPRHGLSTARNWGCKCGICKSAVAQANRRLAERAKRGEIAHIRGGATSLCPCRDCRAKLSRRQKAVQDATLDRASRRGFEWTGPELEIAAREDLTTREVAHMLGRTFHGVAKMRSRMNWEPRKAWLAGLDTDVARLAD